MKIFKFVCLYSVLLIIAILIVVPVAILMTVDSVSYSPQLGLSGTYDIYDDRVAIQQFTPRYHNMSGIGLSIKNPNLRNKNDVLLEVRDKSGNQVRSASLNGVNIPDGSLVKFSFSPVVDSAMKELSLVLSSPDTPQNEALGVYLTDNDDKRHGNLQLTNEESDQSLALIAYYSPEGVMELVLSAYKDFVNRVSFDLLFLGSYFAVILVILIKLVNLNRN